MLVSTLPELPGRTFDVRGLVFAHAALNTKGATQKMVQSLIEQAGQFGADGIIDLKTVIGGEYGHCVMTATAIKIR
jgi:uncharacterized protein YbjQ (UPF0145 family)